MALREAHCTKFRQTIDTKNSISLFCITTIVESQICTIFNRIQEKPSFSDLNFLRSITAEYFWAPFFPAESSCGTIFTCNLSSKMVFCYQNCSDLLWKKMFWWSSKYFEIRGWRLRICKNFEVTRTICSNSERSEQFFFTWRFLRYDKLEQL